MMKSLLHFFVVFVQRKQVFDDVPNVFFLGALVECLQIITFYLSNSGHF